MVPRFNGFHRFCDMAGPAVSPVKATAGPSRAPVASRRAYFAVKMVYQCASECKTFRSEFSRKIRAISRQKEGTVNGSSRARRASIARRSMACERVKASSLLCAGNFVQRLLNGDFGQDLDKNLNARISGVLQSPTAVPVLDLLVVLDDPGRLKHVRDGLEIVRKVTNIALSVDERLDPDGMHDGQFDARRAEFGFDPDALTQGRRLPLLVCERRQDLRESTALAAVSAHGANVDHARRVLLTAGSAVNYEPRYFAEHLVDRALIRAELAALMGPSHGRRRCEGYLVGLLVDAGQYFVCRFLLVCRKIRRHATYKF